MTMTQNSQKAIAIQELAQAVDSIADADIVGLAGNILKARNVVCFGAGREGLMMRGFTMRLFHAGITANYIADMTCPALGQGDLLVVAIGPGTLRSVETYATIAREAGATIICITAQPEKVSSDLFDQVIEIRAQTMASDQGSQAALPMGSAFEIALLVMVDLVTNKVRAARQEDAIIMRGRHTNLE